jgi:ubiquinone/menaquinone biosynthesis C-methylase UbiE
MHNLYENRRLTELHPDLDRLALEKYKALLQSRGDSTSSFERLLRRLNRVVKLNGNENVLVVGCGPVPKTLKFLLAKSYNAIGIEPVSSFVCSGREYIGSTDRILQGAAESIPVGDDSQHLVICESVLEHVDSPSKSLAEIFRVLSPGGVAFINTTNRYIVSLSGRNEEFNLRYFNWLPAIIKEAFVFHHLHYDPNLANYAERPAVHWYSYAALCRLGRDAGFCRFYSVLDLVDLDDPAISGRRLQTFLLKALKFNPWLRALALTQLGHTIVMLKRSS